MNDQTRPRRQALRRYPALAFLVVAAVLAVALPSALNIPNAGPPTLAEFAPVPGRAEQSGGDLARLGSGSSGDLGFGTGDGGAGIAPSLDPGQPGGARKRCVGSPPRQTEDMLSPPCVAFFEGDNGGATTRGVTRDEIVVVLSMENDESPHFVDYAEPITDEEYAVRGGPLHENKVAKAYMRYFNDRYQTYGRTVHLYGYYGRQPGSGEGAGAAARADLIEIEREKKPFALIPQRPDKGEYFATEAPRKDILTVMHQGFNRGLYQRNAPYLISYAPDTTDTARIAASYLCRKLNGRDARFSGEVTDQSTLRTFGILYTQRPGTHLNKDLVRLFKERVRRECGVDISSTKEIAGAGQATYDDYPVALAQMRSEGVTTVIPILDTGASPFLLNGANAIGWHPEWFFFRLGTGDLPDDARSARILPQDQWQHAFGMTFDYRRAHASRQHWYLALQEACPDCGQPTGEDASLMYETLTMLFYGIQAAGPRLTADTLDRGLHAIPERPSTSPYVPATYFTPGNYSWVKDAKMMWWDPAGQVEGENAVGCYRLPHEGKRYRNGEWPRGDRDLFSGSPSCQGTPAFA
jgi:hypothetical protein